MAAARKFKLEIDVDRRSGAVTVRCRYERTLDPQDHERAHWRLAAEAQKIVNELFKGGPPLERIDFVLVEEPVEEKAEAEQVKARAPEAEV
jgi:hypothetical protein